METHSTAPFEPAEPRPRRRRKWLWLAFMLGAAVLIFIMRGRVRASEPKQSSKKGATGAVTILTATAKQGNIGVYLNAIGTVTPMYTDMITSQVTGLISKVHYKEGQIVHEGDPLIDIDARPYQAQLTQAQGALQRDTFVLDQAKMDLERYRQAWARNAIAKQTLDDQEKAVLQDEGLVKSDQGTVQYDEVQVSFCHITAPISGQVGLRLVDPGNVVQANSTTPLVVITQLQPITVVFPLAEDNLGKAVVPWRHGVALTVDAFDRTDQTKIASGKLHSIDNQIDTTTGTVKLRATFDNRNNALFPNQFVNTKLLYNTLRNVTLIPASAIQTGNDKSFVYVIQNQHALMRTVQTGVSDKGMIQVTGVGPGDVVANSGFEKLQNGSLVSIAKNSTPAAAAGSPQD